ncbi:MAG: 3D domain-containing protein [Phycisphaerales bacterium]|nr:3D domain-containing protein [Phycisphaerales bacterium]
MQMPNRGIGATKRQLRIRRNTLETGAFVLAALLAASTAVLAKEARHGLPSLAAVSMPEHSGTVTPAEQPAGDLGSSIEADTTATASIELASSIDAEPGAAQPVIREMAASSDPEVRWFNGRPVRPKKYITMTVTAYSPDARSCAGSDDGITATLHDVTTNAHRLVAADPRILKYGSMLTVPGYDSDMIVPVLDCGGKIKGSRLDVLFPTHEQARAWGVRKLQVTVWEYADGKPTIDPRKLR